MATGWHGQASLLSNYFYRGYSKSRNNPVLQGNLDFEHESGGFAGLSISEVSFDDKGDPDRASVEIKPYLGWTLGLPADWRAEISAAGYVYDGNLFGRTADYVEFYSALHYQDWLTARIALAPDAYQRRATTLDYELEARYDLLDTVRLSAGLGYFQAGELLRYDYFYWNAGMTWYPMKYLSIDLRYVDTHVGNETPRYTGQFRLRPLNSEGLFSISVGF